MSSLVTLYGLRDAINLAIDQVEESYHLREEVAYWKEQYNSLLNSSVKEAQQTSGRMLRCVLSGAIRPVNTSDVQPFRHGAQDEFQEAERDVVVRETLEQNPGL